MVECASYEVGFDEVEGLRGSSEREAVFALQW